MCAAAGGPAGTSAIGSRHHGFPLPWKNHRREIYASGGGLLVAPINAPPY